VGEPHQAGKKNAPWRVRSEKYQKVENGGADLEKRKWNPMGGWKFHFHMQLRKRKPKLRKKMCE